MKLFKLVFALVLLTSCGDSNIRNRTINDNRKQILGRRFSNTEVLSIDIVEIEHPHLGGVVSTTTLSNNQKEEFLKAFDELNQKGIFKCGEKYVIRLNFKDDTLRLKVCENLIANRTNDMYYELKNKKNILDCIK